VLIQEPSNTLYSDPNARLVMEKAEPVQMEGQPIGSLYLMVTQTYWTLPGATTYQLNYIDPDVQGSGSLTTVQKQTYNDQDAGTIDYLTLNAEFKPINVNVGEMTVRLAIEFPVLTEYDQDEETLALITTTYQVVDASTVVAPSVVQGVITSFKRLDKWRSLKIVRTISLPSSYSESRFGAWSIPYLGDFNNLTQPFFWSSACGTFLIRRSAFSTNLPMRTDVSFGTSRDTSEGLTILPQSPLLGNGVSFTNIIMDDYILIYFGACAAGPFTLPASSPSFSTYVSTYQNVFTLMDVESVLWKAQMYKTTKLYVKLK
jgi:hypothetical protein